MDFGFACPNKKKTNILLAVFLFIAAAAVWYSYYDSVFNGLLYNDAMDYASIGRNVARGEGFVSAYITPLGLQYYGIPHPNPWRAPLWPLILAFSMQILGSNDNAVAVTTGLFFVLTVPLIYLIGQNLFNRAVGFCAALIFMFSGLALHFGVSGLTEPLAAFLMCLWLYLLTGEKLEGPRGDLIIGLIGGVFYLARYNALVFLPFVLFYLMLKRRKKIFIILRFVAGFLIPTAPWFIRNFLLFGSPLFSLQKFEPVMFTAAYPEYSLYMMLKKPDVLDFIVSHPGQVMAKVKTGWLSFAGDFFNPSFSGIHWGLMVLCLLALVWPLGKKTASLKLVLAGSFCAQLAALLVIHYIPRLFFLFVPFYILLGLAFVWRLLERLPSLKLRKPLQVLVLSVLTTVFILGNLPDWNSKHTPEPVFKKFSAQITFLANHSTRSDLIISNDGHMLSWYGDRNASKIPYSPEMLPQLNRYQKARYLFLSSRSSWNIPEADKEWQEIYWARPQEFNGYVIRKVFADGSLIYEKKP
ncbi:ArnT family glycosyltransferase [Thermincola potens]|uniref:4-amino-4-deoxy-L-arabinose transferase-like glycosyltransferase of PMT family n=1 Tax=Thermincola potens (strain JR) TaxID=635013 RepID=D5XCZ0_THEPJ|nr:glycosyltransferase family 39 protein [Thermincola potens]ADG83666.1 4-amino-4-deoxy-L-arabinose transferase-like glycosyltransferase of PMT family [Thermincola potens JR]